MANTRLAYTTTTPERRFPRPGRHRPHGPIPADLVATFRPIHQTPEEDQ